MIIFLCCLFYCAISFPTTAQITQDATRQLEIYEDDDFFNVWGQGTDRAYTNGSGIGYLFMKEKKSILLDKWILPRAANATVNVYNWELMQMIITPSQLSEPGFQPNDFYYAGALFATYGLTSYNSEKKYSFYSAIILGILGPWALGRETQTFFHKLIDYQPPQGWEHQVPNAPLLNYNFSYEKMLWNSVKNVELIGGATARIGSMITGLTLLSYIRYGLFNPYFGNSDLSAATCKKFQLYIIARPEFSIIVYNALLQGGIFSSRDTNFEEDANNQVTHMRHYNFGIDYGVGIVIKRTSILYTQKTYSEWMSGTGKHSVGNITLLLSLSRKTIPHS